MFLKKGLVLGVALSFSSILSAEIYDADTVASKERQVFLDEVTEYLSQQSMSHFELVDLAEEGDKTAAWYVSQMYHMGVLVDKDIAKSKQLAEVAGLNGNIEAADYLSRHPSLSRQDQLAWTNEAAASRHPKSLFYLGKAYLEADGVQRDLDLAMFYLARSAALGYEPAKRLRQDILDQQIKLPSFGDILENARSGQIDSLRRLAEAYRNGILIDRNIAKANLIDQQIQNLVREENNHRSNLAK